jgi:triosephosphate isomerase
LSSPNRQPLISGNWKMHLTHLEAIAVVQKLAFSLGRQHEGRPDVSVHPPFTALRSVQTLIDADGLPLALGAQDVYWREKGPFTGEISPVMLAKLNVSYVIVGHSERREHFGETDESVNQKLAAVVAAGMTPILCVGETLEEREAGATDAKVDAQLRAGLAGLDPVRVAGLVVAYEPIWAIGTGRTATPEDAQAVCSLLRSTVRSDFGAEAGDGLRVQYGGSVKAANIAAFMAQPDIDGALVGGASLDPEEFSQIVLFSQP